MGTQEHFGVMQGRERGVVDGDEAEFFQTVAFLAVVHDVAQTIERASSSSALLMARVTPKQKPDPWSISIFICKNPLSFKHCAVQSLFPFC